jgi:formylglycine-generating enzyme required for sulfatase activity
MRRIRNNQSEHTEFLERRRRLFWQAYRGGATENVRFRNIMKLRLHSQYWFTLAMGLIPAVFVSLEVQADSVDFTRDIKPILELNCVVCHNPPHAHENGELDLSAKSAALKGGERGGDLVAGSPEKSLVFKYVSLPPNEKHLMPPKDKGGPLKPKEIELLRQWISAGAVWPDNVTLTNIMKVDFVRDIRPILEKGGPLPESAIATLKLWLEQGAVWPADQKLGEDKESKLIAEIEKAIKANTKETDPSSMQKYTEPIPGTAVTFDMVPIPAGEFLMGSPMTEAHRKLDEGPQHKVAIEPFWMGRCEVTWDEYELFMYPDSESMGGMIARTNADKVMADAVTHPSKPYVEMSFGMGKHGFPAISMTQHGANKYCEWLSARTGHFYRLPTEAEWEYASRAGSTNAYFFGDDPAQLKDYAWYEQNSDFKYQKVGKKKPNPWGLYDIYGNAAEWVLDQYDPDYYRANATVSPLIEPWNKATKPYPHTVRGGSWDDEAAACRSAARRGSDKTWKMQDPQLPKSIWYLTDAQFLGFRLVRPLKVPSPQQMREYWNSGTEKD